MVSGNRGIQVSEAGQVAQQRGKLSTETGRGEDETSEMTVSRDFLVLGPGPLVSPAVHLLLGSTKMLCHAIKLPL